MTQPIPKPSDNGLAKAEFIGKDPSQHAICADRHNRLVDWIFQTKSNIEKENKGQ